MLSNHLPKALLVLVIFGSGCSKEKNTEANNGPEAQAGADITLYLPNTSTILDGLQSTATISDISSYSWTQIEGLKSVNIQSANAARTQVTNLIGGPYAFALKVTDTRGNTDHDTVRVRVLADSLTSNIIHLPDQKWECNFGCAITIQDYVSLVPAQRRIKEIYYRDDWYNYWQIIYSINTGYTSELECFFFEKAFIISAPNFTKAGMEGDIMFRYD